MTDSRFGELSFLLPTRAEPSALDRFEHWLSTAESGSEYVYATGIWLDTRHDEKRAVARAAWKAYDQGRVELAQRPNEQGMFDYICQKRRVIEPHRASSGCGALIFSSSVRTLPSLAPRLVPHLRVLSVLQPSRDSFFG